MNGPKPHGPVIFLMGPTASGKSALGLDLAHNHGLEIVNADSVQIYRDLTIGTAKPTPKEQEIVRHHLLDRVALPDIYSADRYREEAWGVIAECHARRVVPLFVGGSGLYFRAVEQGLATMPAIDPAIRNAVRAEGEQLGWPILHDRLKLYDAQLAQRIPEKDSQRIGHALSVVMATGIPLSVWQQRQPAPPPLKVLKIILQCPRDVLYQRIESRFDQMLDQGLLMECERLWRSGHDREHPLMKAVGYRQLLAFLDGKLTLEEAVAWAKQESRRYAKRQVTWFKRESGVVATIPWDDAQQAFTLVQEFLFHHWR